LLPRQKGYVYFQDFLPDNSYDTRLIVIGNRCFGIRRYNRKNDFRASGAGLLDYKPENIDKRTIKIAFDIANKLESDCLAFDFLYDSRMIH
jgi:glutathione synthase/RimK-type ligase-like ATP-grasp enzyme